MPHALIIGAGPAGTIAAIALRRRDWEVTIVEQHRFPRHKVCGECLSAKGIDVLRALDLEARLKALNPRVLTSTNLHGRAGEFASIPLPRAMWGLSRFAMDTALLQCAIERKVKVHQPARCEYVEGFELPWRGHPAHALPIEKRGLETHATSTSHDVPCARIREIEANSIHTIHADHLFLADGKSPEHSGDLGISAHFANVDAPPDAIGLYSLDGHYVGLAPVENNSWNIAFSVPVEKVKRAIKIDRIFESACEENPHFAKHLTRATRITDWHAAPLCRHRPVRNLPSHITAIGNAAAAIEPIGGEGMGLAMTSALQAAENLAVNPNLWRLRSVTCRAAAVLMSSPASGATIEFAGANDRLATKLLSLLGKR